MIRQQPYARRLQRSSLPWSWICCMSGLSGGTAREERKFFKKGREKQLSRGRPLRQLEWVIFRAPPVLVCLLLASAGLCAGAESTVTFNRDIAPILFGNCASCHRPGNSAP